MNEYFDRAFGEEAEPLMLTLCLEEETILISYAVIRALEYPKQVQMLINEEKKMLLLKACSTKTREAVVIPQQPMLQFEISGKALLRRIRRLTGWEDDLPRVMNGSYLGPHRAILFNLLEAQPAVLRIPEDDLRGLNS